MSFSTIIGSLLLVAALSGSATAANEARIINGTTASNGKYRYQVSLQDDSNAHFCGGSILNHHWVLTAAQCLDTVTDFTVVVGTHSLSSGGVSYEVETFIKHPSYVNTTMIYDAGVVKTVNYIEFSSTVQPVSLMVILPITGAVGVVTGWGYTTGSSGTTSNELKALNTTLISQFNCQNLLTNINFTVQSTQICTYTSLKGACVGDEGGPLVLGNVQFGIVSVYSCEHDYPDVYTKIPSIYTWVIANT